MSTAKKRSVATRSGSRAGRWRLQDAKARFSEVVREAQQRGPQRVTLHGKDAVVIVGAEEIARHQRSGGLAACRCAVRAVERQVQSTGHQPVRGWLLDTNVVSELHKPRPNP